MTKKELKALNDEDLIVQLVMASLQLGMSSKICKCDLKDFDYTSEEIIARGIISNKDKIALIKKEATF